jgi:GT2 family glycosyltransferase
VLCSVIVPTYNRPDQLDRCLGALAAQQGGEFEVVVVDDGSAVAVEPICLRHGPRIRCIRQENSGPGPARNTGASAARGEFLAFTDDDCLPRPDWLLRLREAHGGRPERMVGGLVVNGLPADRFASASQALCDFLYDYFRAADGQAPFFTSNNIAMAKEAFARLGGFDTTFRTAAAEDRDLGIRWREMGGDLVFCPDAIVDHFHHMTLRRFWRQHANYGAGARHLHRVMEARNVGRPRFERLGFYGRLVTWPIRQHGLRGADLAGLMVLSQTAMVAGYLRARRNKS